MASGKKEKEIAALVKAGCRGNISLTIELAKRFVATYPESSFGWFILGDVLVDVARYDDAKIALTKCIKGCKKKNLYRPYTSMGHLYKKKGNNVVAERWYRKALKILPNDHYILVFLGASLAKQGNFIEAKKYHRKAIKYAGREADEAYFNLGLILRAEEKYLEASTAFEQAIKLDPKYKIAKEALKDVRSVLKMKGDI